MYDINVLERNETILVTNYKTGEEYAVTIHYDGNVDFELTEIYDLQLDERVNDKILINRILSEIRNGGNKNAIYRSNEEKILGDKIGFTPKTNQRKHTIGWC